MICNLKLPFSVRCVLRNTLWMLTAIVFIILDVWILGFLFGTSTTFTSLMEYLFTDFSTYKKVLVMDNNPLVFKSGRSVFRDLPCGTKSCVFVKYSPKLNPLDYQAVLFTECAKRPKDRDPSQLYIYSSVSSPEKKPTCDTCHEGFYNWTFTYRLDSNIIWRYFIVKNAIGEVVGKACSRFRFLNCEVLSPPVL